MQNNGLRLLILKEFLKIPSFNQKILREGGVGQFIEFFASKIGNKTAKDIWMVIGNKIIGKDIKSTVQLSTEEAKVLNDFFGKFPRLSRVVFASGDTIEKILDATSTAVYQKTFSNLTQEEQDLVFSYVRNPDSLASKLEKRASEIAAQAPAATQIAYDTFIKSLENLGLGENSLYEFAKTCYRGSPLSDEEIWNLSVRFMREKGITVTNQIEKDAKSMITTNVKTQIESYAASAAYQLSNRAGKVSVQEAGSWLEGLIRLPRKIVFDSRFWTVVTSASLVSIALAGLWMAGRMISTGIQYAKENLPASLFGSPSTPSATTSEPTPAPRGPRIGGPATGGSPSASSPPAKGGGGIEAPPK